MKPTSNLEAIKPSYIREILSSASSKDIISFAGGLPNEESFPLQLMATAFTDLMSKPELFQYSTTIGYGPLLEKLTDLYNVRLSNQLMVTSGSQQALDLIARAFISPGDEVLVESPCYLGALQVFELAQANVLTVGHVDGQLDIEKLKDVLVSNKIKLFYLVADFQNPTGMSHSKVVREKIAQLCRQYEVTIIEDSPYRELRFEGESLPLISSYYPEGTIILRSFSKIMSPGIRIATIEAEKSMINNLVKVKQIADLHSNIPSQFVILELLNNPLFYSHLARVKESYREKKVLMMKHLKELLGENICVNNVEGGMFLWVSLNTDQPIDAMLLAKRSLLKGVAVVPGDVFCSERAVLGPCLRLNFSHSSAEEIIIGITRLSKVIKSFIVC